MTRITGENSKLSTTLIADQTIDWVLQWWAHCCDKNNASCIFTCYLKLQIPWIETEMLFLVVRIIPPALFVDTQVYNVVCGEVVGTSNDCIGMFVTFLTALSFLYHCTVGVGSPSALQMILTGCPTLAVYGDH